MQPKRFGNIFLLHLIYQTNYLLTKCDVPICFRLMSRRLKLKGRPAVYHCISRTVGGDFLLGNEEKAVLRKQMWQIAEFCGVEILTYCILSNHFHMLVSVPDKDSVEVSDAELLRRYRVMYPEPTVHQTARIEVLEAQLNACGEDADKTRESLLSRMHDVSAFMQSLKQRFSVWYNRSRDRFGTVWAERYRGVLVQGGGFPLYTMARYIDLNPIRAGLVEDPKDYQFCGYSEAVAGNERAKSGISKIVATYLPVQSMEKRMEAYRRGLFGSGSKKADGKRGKISRELAEKVLAEKGKLPSECALLMRLRHFTAGGIIGCRQFVEEHVRTKGRRAASIKQAELDGIFSERDLQKNPIS